MDTVGKMLYATTKSSITDVGYDEMNMVDQLWICYDKISLEKEPAILNTQQQEQLFGNFLKMVNTMTTAFTRKMEIGTEFVQNGQFHSLYLKRLTLSQLSGLRIRTDYLSVFFPHPWVDDEFVPLIADELNNQNISLSSVETPLTLAVYTFMNNIIEPQQPFNMLTISINLYMDDGLKLEWHSHESNKLPIVVRPLVEKSKRFWQQKIYAQCDVNQIKCKKAENAHRLGTLVVFQSVYDSGHFLLTIPIRRLEFSYKAYISVNSLPMPNSYVWLFTVSVDGDQSSANLVGGGKLEKPTFHHDGVTDTKILIPYSAIHALTGLSDPTNNKKHSIQVLIQEDYSQYGYIHELPDVACELHRVYGFQLRLKPTGVSSDVTNNKLRRKKRTTSIVEDDADIKPTSDESSVNLELSALGDFGLHVTMAPNRIQFVDLYKQFDLMEYNNIPVLMFLTFLIAFCCIFTIWAHFMDKRDLKMWSYRPIVGNRYFENVNYLVTVHYGRIKHKKLGPKVSICLLGDVQDTIWKELTDNSENVSISILVINYLFFST